MPVIVGVLVAATVATLIVAAVGPVAPVFGIAAPVCGIAAGGYVAGKLAKYAGLLQGAMVGIGYIAVEVSGLAPAPVQQSAAGIAETVWIILGDGLVLVVASLFGYLAAPQVAPSSSSDRGRGR